MIERDEKIKAVDSDGYIKGIDNQIAKLNRAMKSGRINRREFNERSKSNSKIKTRKKD